MTQRNQEHPIPPERPAAHPASCPDAVEHPPRRKDGACGGTLPDARLVEQLRQGDPEAGHRFVRDHYPGIYRYLLYLTGRRETAADLTQETFLQAWRRLETFDGRRPLRPWLHRIAHREFLQALRSQRSEASLEEIPEVAAPEAGEMTAAVELRTVMARLPLEVRDVLVLHYLEGYSYQEIARIVDAPLTTVKYRLTAARAALQRELGEGDLTYFNERPVGLHQWAWLPLEQMQALEARWAMGGTRGLRGSGQLHIENLQFAIANCPLPGAPSVPADREVPEREANEEETMERREFLRSAATGAAGLMLPEVEKEVIDSRLTQKVTLAFKGAALADVCERLQTDTSIHLVAGNSVADEKVTLFCSQLPLREVMRQLSRPFGYAWVRSGTPGAYKYELLQDLRSQLLEEELRNRDRNEALVALDRDMEKYRPYLTLSPDEALARAQTAAPEDRKRLEYMGGVGWGPIQMYFRLSPQQQAALRAGQELEFHQDPKSDQLPLPDDVARGVLQARRNLRLVRAEGDKSDPGLGKEGERFRFAREDETDGVPPSAVPEARGAVSLRMHQTELGRFGFDGSSTVSVAGSANGSGTGPYAVGVNPNSAQPENARLNARLAGDPALRRRVTLQPKPSCRLEPTPGDAPTAAGGTPAAEDRVTTADVLEALHRATGMPVVADFFTRLYRPETVSATNQGLFDALNRLSDAMRLRWHKEAANGQVWLQFRSMSFYNDRPKEVPNRLLTRWAAARREHGALTLDDLIEIAGLPDPSLDAQEMAEGVRACWGLAEWDLACNDALRPHFRWMASFTPILREKLQRPPGVRFTELPVQQQQRFMALALGSDPKAIDSLAELETAAMQVDYSLPGGFEWKAPEQQEGPPAPLAPVRAATREAALAAARRINPQAEPVQIQPTQRRLTLLYRWGTPQAHGSLRISTGRRGDTSIGRSRSKESS